MTVDGLVRSYTLVRPLVPHPGQLVPLVVAIHGYTVDSTWMEKTTQFDELAKSARFIVVYPQGLNNSWNAGSCCGDNHNADVAFIRELLDRLVADDQVNPNRVLVTGMSNGGMMAHRLACDLSDRILAIASVSGALTFMDRRQVLKGARAIGATALAALVPASVSAAQNDKVE